MALPNLITEALQDEARAALARAHAELQFALTALASTGASTALIDATLHACQTACSAALAADRADREVAA